jgi:hypothetical protein
MSMDALRLTVLDLIWIGVIVAVIGPAMNRAGRWLWRKASRTQPDAKVLDEHTASVEALVTCAAAFLDCAVEFEEYPGSCGEYADALQDAIIAVENRRGR